MVGIISSISLKYYNLIRVLHVIRYSLKWIYDLFIPFFIYNKRLYIAEILYLLLYLYLYFTYNIILPIYYLIYYIIRILSYT